MPFKRGKSGNPAGKPKGAVNKLPKSVKEGFLNAFIELQDDPKNKIIEWAKKNPNLFYTLASKLIPTEVKGAINGKTTLEIVRKSGNTANP